MYLQKNKPTPLKTALKFQGFLSLEISKKTPILTIQFLINLLFEILI